MRPRVLLINIYSLRHPIRFCASSKVDLISDDMMLVLSLLALSASLSLVRPQYVSFQTGLCGTDNDTCIELNDEDKCRNLVNNNSPTLEADWTTTCDELASDIPRFEGGVLSRTCFDQDPRIEFCTLPKDIGCRGNCVSATEQQRSMWPEFNTTTIGVNSSHYMIDITWSPPIGVNVSGYYLLVSNTSIWNRCNNYTSKEVCRDCIIELDNNTFFYQLLLFTNEYRGGHKYNKPLHIKLIPHGWCDGPNNAVYAPRTCHHICPGNCRRCGVTSTNYYSLIFRYPPKTLLNYTLCRNYDSTYSTTFWWESGIPYERPNPKLTFYFFLTTNNTINGRFTRYIKSRQMPVRLQNLTLQKGLTYYVWVQQYECICTKYSGFPFTVGSTVGNCNSTEGKPTTSTFEVNPSSSVSASIKVHSTSSPTHVHSASRTMIEGNGPGKSLSSNTDNVPLHMIAALSGVLVITLVVVLVALFVIIFRRVCSSHRHSKSNPSQVSPACKRKIQLLVLYSWGTSERNQEYILQCLSPIACDTEMVYSAKAHVRGGIPQWVEKHVNASDKVLIICNKPFSNEWQNPGVTFAEGAIVHALKAIISGHTNNGTLDEVSHKIALVFIKEKHKKLVPSRILHSFKQFMLYEEMSEKQNELFRFITDTPLFQFCTVCDDEQEMKVEVE